MTIEDHILLNTLLERDKNETLFEGSLDEIYLTYLAIVTMPSTDATTLHYNSMQKRDIAKNIYTDDNNDSVKLNAIGQLMELQTIQNTTKKHLTKKLLPKKKFKTIGRPKAYKIEELSNTSGDHKDEKKNYRDITEAALKRKMDFYYDYTVDTSDENLTIATEKKIIEKKDFSGILIELPENYTFEDHTYEMIPMRMANTMATVFVLDKTQFNTDGTVKTETAQGNLIKTTTRASGSIATKENTVDDYLSDPETVRQLQEALDRIEHNVSNTSSSTGKTRRNVQDTDMSENEEISNAVTPFSDDANYTLLAGDDISSTLSPELDGNNSSDTPPVLSMMLKYMPYLKHYENDILRPQNSAACLSYFDGNVFACLSGFLVILLEF